MPNKPPPKANPLNPLEWLRATQDWFKTTEKSSGFRAYLIFLFLLIPTCLSLLYSFKEVSEIRAFSIYALAAGFGIFMLLYVIKSISDPPFCRSEKHVERLREMEIEQLGYSGHVIDAAEVELKLLTEAERDVRPPSLPPPREEGRPK